MKSKNLICMAMVLCLLVGLCGCGNTSPSAPTSTEQLQADIVTDTPAAGYNAPTTNSSSLDGTILRNLGLKLVSVDEAADFLTDEQKSALQYFGQTNYFNVDYEFLQRYPQIYEGAEIVVTGQVKKVLSSDSNSFEILLWDIMDEDNFYYRSVYGSADYYDSADYNAYREENSNHLMVVKGEQLETRIIEGDWLKITGRLNSIDAYTIDGVFYSIPTVTSNSTLISGTEGSAFGQANFQLIKKVATALFGQNIEVRKPVEGVDIDEGTGWLALDDGLGTDPFYIVELENQSNAKFTKYRFHVNYPCIEDAKGASDQFWVLSENENIQRNIEFSSDFQHYYLFTYDYSLKNLTVEYYDKNFNKLWKREFENTTDCQYDCTVSHVYLNTNNNLYVIDVTTGEDAFAPAYVGNKGAIRKLQDGILMLSLDATDAIMKTDDSGSVLWKTSLDSSFDVVFSLQLVGDDIVLYAVTSGKEHYLVVDQHTGELKLDATHI